MEAVPRLPMICCDLKVSPSNTEFGPVLKKYIRDHYHEDPESYSKEIKELETLRQNAIKAPMDFTGCSILKKYYSQLQKLQSRFPMTDDGAACVPFMWTDIYSGVAYNITDIEYEEACILYNIGALHSKLGTMDSRINAEGIKIACTHFQCAAFAFQHLRDTYPQPKGSDMSHDLLTFFINVMLAQAQECILEKSMLDNRKSSITAKIAAQVVDYYKCGLGIMVSGSPSTDTGSILDIVGSKIYKGWKKFIEFKMSYYGSISHLYMGNQAEENEKWGERVAWFQSAFDHLTEAFKIAKKIDREDLNEALTFTNDVIGGKHSSSKKENDFVYHDKVPSLSSLPELKGASLVKGIPFDPSDPDVSGPDIFARLVPMEAHETSSLYSEEKAKILRSVATKIEGKNGELMAYLSSLQLESATSFDDEDKVPQDLIEKCAALSVRPTAISDLANIMNELLEVSKDVETSLKSSAMMLAEEEKKELKHQETFGKRGPSMITVELKKECSKYEEAHKKAIESNNTLQAAVNIHIANLNKLSAPLDQITESLPSACSIKTPENVKIMDEFNHLVNKVEEMRKQREFLENQLRDALMKDDITKRLVTLKNKEDAQRTFDEELKKHDETLKYLDQNLAAQDNILCALTEANARYADIRKALSEIRMRREEMIKAITSSFDAYEDLLEKAKKGLDFYKKLQCNVTRLFTRIKSVTKVQDEERTQRAEAELRKGGGLQGFANVSQEQNVPKLKDYLPYLNKRNGTSVAPAPSMTYNVYPSLQQNIVPGQLPFSTEPVRQATLGGPASANFDRSLKPSPIDSPRQDEKFDISSMGVRPTPVGSEQTSVSAMCTTALPNIGLGNANLSMGQQPWNSAVSSNIPNGPSQTQYDYSTQHMMPMNNTVHFPFTSNAVAPVTDVSVIQTPHSYQTSVTTPNTLSYSYNNQNYSYSTSQLPISKPAAPGSVYPSASASPTNFIPSTSLGSYPPAGGVQPNLPHPTTRVQTSLPHPAGGVQPNLPHPASGVRPSLSHPAGGVQPSLPQSTGGVQPSLPHPSSSTYLPNSTTPPLSANLSNSAVLPKSLQAFSSAQASVSTNYPNSLNYTTSTVTSSTISPALPQSGVLHSSGFVSTDNYTAQFGGIGDGNAAEVGNTSQINNISSSYAMTQHSYNLPNSLNQQNIHISSIPRVQQQSQPYPTWQANSGLSSNYTAPSTSYNVNTGSTVQYNTPASSLQYYHGSGIPVQANHASVTAAMDTKTNTMNSLNPYAIASSNVNPYLGQSMQNYAPNLYTSTSNTAFVSGGMPTEAGSSVSTVNHSYTNAAIPGIQTVNKVVSQNEVSIHASASSAGTVVYNSVPSTVSNVSSSGYYQYPTSNNQVPNAFHSGNTSLSTSVQNSSGSQISSYPIAMNMQSSPYDIPNQQAYQITAGRNDSVLASFGSSPNIPNQQLPTPMEPKPVDSAQTNPSTLNNYPVNGNPQTSVTESPPKSASTDQISMHRDFITPPPDSVVNTDVDKVKETAPVLQPKVIDLKAIAELKEKDSSHLAKDPLDDPSVCAKFVLEVEKYEKFVDGLVRKSLNGTTPLDQKWKEFTDVQDKESRKMSISVARCCPLKNRFPDVMPYDSNRVKLTSAKDDYINASYLKDICPNSPVFVITQAPLPTTFSDFWLMVWEQQVETLVCLLSDSELKNHIYYPKERGQVLTFGAYEISLHSVKEKNGFVERLINITHSKNRMSRVVVHLQFTEWPISGVPLSPATLLQFVTETLSYYKQQRNLARPIVVHCSAGIGRSGCFCIITAMVSEMSNGHGPRDVAQVVASVSNQRKFLMQDKDQLKFCYDTVLYYAQDLLMRRGILTTRASFDDKLPGSVNTSSHVRHPSEDFILGGGLAKLQCGIAKLGLSSGDSETKSSESETKPEVKDTKLSETPTPLKNEDVKQDCETVQIISKEATKPEADLTDNEESLKSKKSSTNKHVSPLTSLLDPSNFTLDSGNSPAKRKITRENFASAKGSLSTSSSDNADPLSQLDPLWSLKK